MERTLVTIPLGAGLAQNRDAVVMDPPGFAALSNKTFSKDGALDTRPCTAKLGSTLGSTLAGVGACNSEVLAFAYDGVSGYSETAGAFVSKGNVSEWGVGKMSVAGMVGYNLVPGARGVCVIGGKMFAVWAGYDAGGVYSWTVRVLDQTTGAKVAADIVPPALPGALGINTPVRIFSFNGKVYLWVLYNPGGLYSYEIDYGTGAITNTTIVGATAITTFDADAATDRMMAAWPVQNGGAQDLYVCQFDTAGAFTVGVSAGAGTTIDRVALAAGAVGENWTVVFHDSAIAHPGVNVKQITRATVVAVLPAPVNLDSIQSATLSTFTAVKFSSTLALVAIGYTQPTTSGPLGWNARRVRVGVVTATGYFNNYYATFDHAIPYGRPFVLKDRFYIPVLHDAAPLSALAASHQFVAVVEVKHTCLAVARTGGVYQPRLSFVLPRDVWRLPSGVLPSDANALCSSIGYDASIEQFYVPVVSSTGEFAVWTLANGMRFEPYPKAPIGEVLGVGGGVMQEYDGARAFEWGFAVAPEVTYAYQIAGGGALAAGEYRYAAIYEYTDERGNIARSPVATSAGVTVNLNDRVGVCIPYLRQTNRQLPTDAQYRTRIKVYRAEPNATVFRLANTFTNYVNSAGLDVVWTDGAAPGAYDANEPLYTTGNELEEVLPPPAKVVVAHKNRMWLASGQDLWFTKEYVTNSLPGFNDQANVLTIEEGGDVTALASMDSALLVFKRDRVFAVYGDGPSDTGTGNDLRYQRIALGAGAVSGRTVTTHDGVMFYARDGLYLVGRDMSVVYIGAPVESWFDNAPIVRAMATLGATDARVAVDGYVLEYSQTYQRWASWWMGASVVDMAEVWTSTGSTMVYACSDGFVRREASGLTTDDGAGVSTTVTTPWIKLGGIEGFQRARRIMLLGEKVSDTDVTVTVTYDYGGTSQTKVWSNATVSSAVRYGTRLELEMHVVKQKCEAIQVKIEESPGTSPSPGRGITWRGLVVECAVKPSRYKGLPAVARS